MLWNEADHPRDELGKFTFSGGGGSAGSKKEENNGDTENNYLTPVLKGQVVKTVDKNVNAIEKSKIEQSQGDILYHREKQKKRMEKLEAHFKNKLIGVLGNDATNADILYKTPVELVKKVIKTKGAIEGLKAIKKVVEKERKELKNHVVTSKILKNIVKNVIETSPGSLDNRVGQFFFGADAVGMLDLAHGEENMHEKKYIKDAYKLRNYDDPAVYQYKKYLKKKVEEQFEYYGFRAEDVKGYFFKNNSEPSQRIVQNNDFRKFIRKNIDTMLKNDNNSIGFQKHGLMGVFKENNFKNAIGKADIKDVYFDKKGNLHLKIIDTYEYNKDSTDFLNSAGREEMEKGVLKPYFSIHDILIDKDEFDKILNEEN